MHFSWRKSRHSARGQRRGRVKHAKSGDICDEAIALPLCIYCAASQFSIKNPMNIQMENNYTPKAVHCTDTKRPNQNGGNKISDLVFDI